MHAISTIISTVLPRVTRDPAEIRRIKEWLIYNFGRNPAIIIINLPEFVTGYTSPTMTIIGDYVNYYQNRWENWYHSDEMESKFAEYLLELSRQNTQESRENAEKIKEMVIRKFAVNVSASTATFIRKLGDLNVHFPEQDHVTGTSLRIWYDGVKYSYYLSQENNKHDTITLSTKESCDLLWKKTLEWIRSGPIAGIYRQKCRRFADVSVGCR